MSECSVKYIHLPTFQEFLPVEFIYSSLSLGEEFWKRLLWFRLKSVLLMFSSRSFIVAGLAFKSLSHLEFISMYIRECSDFTPLYAAVQFSQYLLLKRMSFSMVQTCLLFPRSVDHRCVNFFFLSFLSCFIDPYFCFCASIVLFWSLAL